MKLPAIKKSGTCLNNKNSQEGGLLYKNFNNLASCFDLFISCGFFLLFFFEYEKLYLLKHMYLAATYTLLAYYA